MENDIYIFGDSHGWFDFANLKHRHHNLSQSASTMHRIGRDKQIPNFNASFLSDNAVFVMCFGEVDCRCHIGKQLALKQRSLDEIVDTLVTNFIVAISELIPTKRAIIVCNANPTTKRADHENLHGPITHEFPFVGTDEERVTYTRLVNSKLKEECNKNGFLFFEFNEHFTRLDGTLQFEKSDQVCHIHQNQLILDHFDEILEQIKKK